MRQRITGFLAAAAALFSTWTAAAEKRPDAEFRGTIEVSEVLLDVLVTDRKGNWVQITDPATAEAGWVYSRFIETAEAPAR